MLVSEVTMHVVTAAWETVTGSVRAGEPGRFPAAETPTGDPVELGVGIRYPETNGFEGCEPSPFAAAGAADAAGEGDCRAGCLCTEGHGEGSGKEGQVVSLC